VVKCEPALAPINAMEKASGEDLVAKMSLDLVENIRRQRDG